MRRGDTMNIVISDKTVALVSLVLAAVCVGWAILSNDALNEKREQLMNLRETNRVCEMALVSANARLETVGGLFAVARGNGRQVFGVGGD